MAVENSISILNKLVSSLTNFFKTRSFIYFQVFEGSYALRFALRIPFV